MYLKSVIEMDPLYFNANEEGLGLCFGKEIWRFSLVNEETGAWLKT